MNNSINKPIIAFLSTYPPRKCGIATFTCDLASAVDNLPSSDLKSKIIAINDGSQTYDYKNGILFQLRDNTSMDYVKAAHIINENENIKAVSIQHEFKLYGSDYNEYGENLLLFIGAITKPVVTTLHTVLPAPSLHRKRIIQSIGVRSEYLVVMSRSAVEILEKDYSIPRSKIVIIPHGIHDVAPEPDGLSKKDLGCQGKILLVSFGLLRPNSRRQSSGRGYEYVLDALPEVVKKFPNILYFIVGSTHPLSLKTEGEKYRNFLENKVKGLGLEEHVQFINKYAGLTEILKYLKAADVYLSSSLNPHQISSGTLSYAMGCGCAVISTPFTHAKEVLTPQKGILLDDFEKPELFSEAIIKLLSNPELKESMRKNAYLHTRHMIWPKVALAYVNLFDRLASLPEEFSDTTRNIEPPSVVP
ncbi:MAG: glycosyltransferase [Candidatus Woesearchaeota archaeon]|jgi:glycosyltransferase involved in cell wall biosynthesis|nr:glycosyltransferase [Candidatus Woesearchaeota archaeon]|tara:strand:- start:58 stop:1308 length:1251 start_codon:yes stop_codon:yes gene_type:complete